VMASLFIALGSERLAQITAAIMEAPYSYRAGWPDLTMTNGEQMLWAEVKTTDRLHMSQISILHRMKPLLPATSELYNSCSVAKVASNNWFQPTADPARWYTLTSG
jgi:hypothetical protein